MEVRHEEYLGFTNVEVRKILEYYGVTEQYASIREWYDGYQFGNLNIYCPWDVINYCGDLTDGSAMEPQNYWVNTSSNDIVRRFIDRADAAARDEIERLINGDSIKKEIRQEALKQIRDKNYEASLTDDGIKTIYKIKSLYNFLISY